MRTLIFLLICLPARLAPAEGEVRILPRDFNASKPEQMMRAYLRATTHEAFDRRLVELEKALESPESLVAYQKRRVAFLKRTFAEKPPRTPLNAQVAGVIREPHMTIEKVLFESQPGFHVTANLYRPLGDGPFPAVLHPVGHSENGKAAAAYQKVNRLLASNGFIVLCYDPIGQGERKQLLGKDGQPQQRGSGEHQNLGVAPILLGRGLGSYMVWDGMRALDYLCSRPDVDKKRLGCTGNSGGGNMTSYLMAYDDRIVAAAPGCFMTTHRQKNEKPGPGDAEQNLYAQIRDGFDHPDFILTRAPKPTLILAATKDFVPIEGTWEAFRQAKRVYTALGYPERVDLVEANAKHGFNKPLREAAARFMCRWLQGRDLEITEPEDVAVLDDRSLQVTPDGQVARLPNEKVLLDLFVQDEQSLEKQRPELTRDIVRRVIGVRKLADIPSRKAESVGPPNAVGEAELLILHPEPGIVLPAVYWPEGEKAPVVMASAKGKTAAWKQAERFHADGHPVLLIEPRDTGETRTSNWRFFGAEYYIALMLGKSWIGMWTEDLLVASRWLSQQHHEKSVQLWASGDLAVAARHATALESNLIAKLTTSEALPSWKSLMNASNAHARLHTAVQGALRIYDLPDLDRLIEKTRQEQSRVGLQGGN